VNAVLAIARRELGAYFSNPIGWIALCAFAALAGFFFFFMLVAYADYAAQAFGASADQLNVHDLIVAMGFAAVLAASTLHFPLLLSWLGEPDMNVVLANYAGFLLLLGTFFAVGMLASSLTENQLVALVVAFGVNLLLWVVGWAVQGADDGALKSFVEALAMTNHTQQLGKGLVHIKDVAYFLTFIGFCLFATTQRVEALRWR
jgi:ABC-type transport system involved in multi-copper enzyme maturation permease subunit